MRVTHWLAVLVVCAVTGVVALATYGKWQTEHIYRSAAYASQSTVPSLISLDEARTHITRLRLLLYRHVTDHFSQGKALLEARIHKELLLAGVALRKYETQSVLDTQDRQMLAEDRRLLEGYSGGIDKILKDSRAGAIDRAETDLSVQAEIGNKLEDALDEHVRYNVSQSFSSTKNAEHIFHDAISTALGFIIFIIGVLLSIGFIISRYISRQVDEIHTLALDNQLFRSIVEGSENQCVLLHNSTDGRVIYANPAACRHFGTDLATILTWEPSRFDPNITEAMLERIDLALAHDENLVLETTHRVASGELIPVEVNLSRFFHLGKEVRISFVQDLRPRLESQARALQMQRLESEQESMRKLTQFEHSSPGLMYTMTLHEDKPAMVYLSPAVEDVFGITVEQGLSDFGSFLALVVPEDRESIRRLSFISRRDMSLYYAEYRIQHPTKGLRWLESRSMPEKLEDDSTAWHGFITDITDRKKMEAALASSEREFRTLVQNLTDFIVRFDTQGQFVYINPRFEKLQNLKLEDIVGKKPTQVPGLPDAEYFEQQVLLAAQRGTSEEFEHLMTAPNGLQVWGLVNITPEFSETGQVAFVQIVIRDITERKHLEEQLATREREFRTLIENSPDMVIRYDLECRRIYVNQAFLKATQANLKDILGSKVTDMAWWSTNISASEFEARLRAVIASGMSETVQLFGRVPSTGAARHTMVRIVPEYNSAGEIESLLAVVRDVSDLVQAEEELRKREQYQRALLDNFPFFVWLKDLDSRLLAVNLQYAKVAKTPSPEALVGKTDFDLFPQELAQCYVEDDRAVLASGLPKNVVEQYRNEHDQLCWMETYKSPVVVDGTIVGTVGFSRDVTEQMKVQTALTNSERELRTLIENSPDVIIRYDRDCRRTYISKNYESVYGNAIELALGKKPTESWGRPIMAPTEYERRLSRVMETGVSEDIELDWYDNEEYVCQSLRAVPEFNSAGNIVSVLTLSRDVSEAKRTALRLKTSEHEFRTLVEHSPELIVRFDLNCRRTFVNPAYELATGFSQDEAQNKPLPQTWRALNMTSTVYEAWLRQIMHSGQTGTTLLQWRDLEGRMNSYDLQGVPEYDIDGKLRGVLVIGHDITELKHAEIGLRQREQEFRALVENTPDTVARYDRDCKRVYANPSMIQEAGIPIEEILGKTPEEFPGGSQAAAYQKQIRQVLETGEPNNFELHWKTGNGAEVCSHIRLTPEIDMDGTVTYVLAVGRDITEIDVYRKQIHNLAFFDPLTSLPNRSLLQDRISQTIADASWHGTKFGLMLLDLDRFKEVNDTLGHGVGDLLLREVADRLLGCVRSYDTVARLGGDEFAILLPEVRVGNDLATVARKILATFEHPFHIAGRELFISTSVGIALYPTDSADIDALFKYADSAMYHAKKQGRSNFQFYSRELTARSSERMQIEAALRRAQKNQELELYYQPQIDLATGKVIGAESLLRWNRGTQGMVTPDRFIPVAEESGLIVGMGEWALLSACKAAATWNRDRKVPLRIAVNLSTRQFIQNDLVASLRYILAETQCKPEWLKLEITESLLLEDSSNILAMLNTFNDMGLTISIDDFGTGYSALSYLNRFPVSQIKIDRSFVRDVPHERDKAELVKAMISIAQSLNLELVAEGVETHQQADYLQAHGCRVVQGYLYGKPMPQELFEAYLLENESLAAVGGIPS